MRINVGSQASVTASEKWLTYIQAGQAFAMQALQGAVAAANSHVQLFNPAASGKTVLVRRVMVSSSLVDQLDLTLYNTALVTDAGAGVNLLSGSAAGVAHVRQTTNAGILGTIFHSFQNPANTPALLGPDWLCQLPAGTGLIYTAATVNQPIVCTFYWAEF